MQHIELENKLGNLYLTMLEQLSVTTYNKVLSKFTESIHAILQASYTSLYVMDQWHEQYEQMIELTNHKDFANISSFIKKIKHQFATCTININNLSIATGYEFTVIPLNKTMVQTGWLVIVLNKSSCSTLMLRSIKIGIERFFSIVFDMNDMKKQKEKNEFLFKFSKRLSTTNNISSILREILTATKTVYPQFSYYILLSQDHDIDHTLPVKTIEYSDDATKHVSNEAFMTGDIQIENRTEETRTYLYAPFCGKQGVYGVLQLITPQIVCFPQGDIKFISEFANISGQAIENATLYQTSHHLVTDLKLINDVTHKLNLNLQLSEIIAVMREQIVNICEPTHIGFIYFKDDKYHTFEVLTESTYYFQTEHSEMFIHYLVQQMKDKHESIFSGDFIKHYPSLPYRSAIVIPMQHDSVLHGMVILLHQKGSAFSFKNFKLIESLIQHSSLALSNAILKDQLEKAVITDYLTKLYSRNYLYEMIHKHMLNDEKGALVLFDIDDFKNINDTYGHHIGDEVIIQVANVLVECSKNKMIPARWGGEELALYLPEATLKDGVEMAGKIRKKVEKNTEPKVTLSSGVSSWSKDKADVVNDVFMRADRALYKAKKSGKNRVITEKCINE